MEEGGKHPPPPVLHQPKKPGANRVKLGKSPVRMRFNSSRGINDQLVQIIPLGLIGEFQLIEEVGEGVTAKVYKVRHKRDNRVYALKKSHNNSKKKGWKNFQMRFDQEVKMISKLHHKNIVQYHMSFVDDKNHFYILMELCWRDLETCFETKIDMYKMIRPQALKIFGDIICAVEYMHGEGVIHRDIKPGNIFISFPQQVCQAKVGDFGLACCENDPLKSVQGAPLYRAPEQSLRKKYDSKVDMFPCGIILFQLLKMEWEDPDDEDAYDDYEGPQWIKTVNDLKDNVEEVLTRFRPFHPDPIEKVIHNLLETIPERRPTAAEVSLQLKKLTITKNSGMMFVSLSYLNNLEP